MHINKEHWTRAAWVSVGLAGVLGMGEPAHAEPVMDLSGAQPTTGALGTTPWSAELATPAMAATDFDGHEPPAADRAGADSAPADRSLSQAGTDASESSTSSAAAARANEDAQWRRELASAVLEVVRPAYEGLAGSGMLDALRSVEAELGLNRSQSFNDMPSGYYSKDPGHNTEPASVAWASPGDRADPFHRPRSSAEIAEDQRNAAIMMKALMEEVKQWVVTLLALYGLGYLVKLALDYRQTKAARRHKRRATGRRRQRHRQHRQRPMARSRASRRV